jgi:hypothetical protein
MGRKLVRENELSQSGGLLSFPRSARPVRSRDLITTAEASGHDG